MRRAHHRIRRLLVAALVAGASLLFATAAVHAEDAKGATPVGKWKTIDDDTGKPKSIVEIFERNGKLYGKITKLLNIKPGEDPDPVCDKCEDKRKGLKIIGMQILWNMVRDDDEWEDGKILDPENGKIYRCRIWLDGPDKLKVRGYIGPFYRTQDWFREK